TSGLGQPIPIDTRVAVGAAHVPLLPQMPTDAQSAPNPMRNALQKPPTHPDLTTNAVSRSANVAAAGAVCPRQAPQDYCRPTSSPESQSSRQRPRLEPRERGAAAPAGRSAPLSPKQVSLPVL